MTIPADVAILVTVGMLFAYLAGIRYARDEFWREYENERLEYSRRRMAAIRRESR